MHLIWCFHTKAKMQSKFIKNNSLLAVFRFLKRGETAWGQTPKK